MILVHKSEKSGVSEGEEHEQVGIIYWVETYDGW
ncbi:hypothetical protein TNCV_3003601, partial [Trichonephila clavipes]